MNSLFTKMGALVLALALCFAAVSMANAETEYPPRPSGTVSDLAGVLGEKALEDLMQVPYSFAPAHLSRQRAAAVAAATCGFAMELHTPQGEILTIP